MGSKRKKKEQRTRQSVDLKTPNKTGGGKKTGKHAGIDCLNRGHTAEIN